MFYSGVPQGKCMCQNFCQMHFGPNILFWISAKCSCVNILQRKYNPRNIESTWNNIALDLLLYNCAIVAVVTLVIFVLLISSASLIYHGVL